MTFPKTKRAEAMPLLSLSKAVCKAVKTQYIEKKSLFFEKNIKI